jgi:tetratricopeptide (TPR) repeat protein
VDGIVISFQVFQFTLEPGLRKLFRMPRRYAFSILVLSLVTCVFQASADTPSKEDLFEKGLAAYQSKQYTEARDAFQKQLDQGHMSPGLLNNMALSVYQLDQKPLALALWRKALSIQPGFQPALSGRNFLETKMNLRPLERDTLSLWTHRNLEAVSFYQLMWVNALILAIAGWLVLRYLGERRFAVEEEQPMPAFPVMAAVFSVVLLFTATVAVYKVRDSLTTRATITAVKASARSLPADEGVGLFDISGGSEVFVRQQQNGWSQIQNAEGSSGWVKNSELFITSN